MADRENRPIRSTADIPAAMRKVYRRLERWRKSRRGRERIGPQCLCCLSKPSGKDDVALIERPLRRRSGRFTGVVVDADYGSNAQFHEALDRLGLPYGVAIRREVSCAVVGVLGTQSGTATALSALDEAWESVTWATGRPPVR